MKELFLRLDSLLAEVSNLVEVFVVHSSVKRVFFMCFSGFGPTANIR